MQNLLKKARKSIQNTTYYSDEEKILIVKYMAENGLINPEDCLKTINRMCDFLEDEKTEMPKDMPMVKEYLEKYTAEYEKMEDE